MFAISGKNALTNTHRDTGTPTHKHTHTHINIHQKIFYIYWNIQSHAHISTFT